MILYKNYTESIWKSANKCLKEMTMKDKSGCDITLETYWWWWRGRPNLDAQCRVLAVREKMHLFQDNSCRISSVWWTWNDVYLWIVIGTP